MMHILFLFAALQAPAPQAPREAAEPEIGAVEGKVLDAVTGAAIRKASVTLRASGGRVEPGTTPQGAMFLTDGDGAFRGTLAPGTYVVTAERNGYVGARTAFPTITLKAKETVKDVTLKMSAHAVISGRVLDQDGEPMARVLVQCVKWMMMAPVGRRLTTRATSQTNDLGEYRLFGLEPGKCLISAQPMMMPGMQMKSAFTYVSVYYPNSREMAGAQAVTVAAGAIRQGVDLVLPKASVVRVSGTLAAMPEGGETLGARPMITLIPRDSVAVMGRGEFPAAPNSKGEFFFENVPSGSYILSAQTFGQNQVRRAGRVHVEVGDRDVSGLSLGLDPGIVLAGQIRAETALEFTRTNVALMPIDGNMRGGGYGTADKEGKFKFQGALERDKYTVRVAGLPEGYFVRSIAMGRHDATETLDLTSGAEGELVVTLEKGTAEISGQVMKDQKPAVGVQVMLLNSKLEPLINAITMAEGRYRLPEIPPGDYRVVAVASTETYDPDVIEQLASSAEKITLARSARETRQLELRQ